MRMLPRSLTADQRLFLHSFDHRLAAAIPARQRGFSKAATDESDSVPGRRSSSIDSDVSRPALESAVRPHCTLEGDYSKSLEEVASGTGMPRSSSWGDLASAGLQALMRMGKLQ